MEQTLQLLTMIRLEGCSGPTYVYGDVKYHYSPEWSEQEYNKLEMYGHAA